MADNSTKKSAAETAHVKRLIRILWCATIVFAALFVISIPKLYCIFPLFIALLLPPVVKYQRVIKKLLPRKWMKPVLLGLLFTAFVISFLTINTDVLNPRANQTASSPVLPSDSFFEVHFIDVGQGDAALINCDGHYMLYDGGNASCSSLIYSYLSNMGIKHIDYIICSHPHEDHVGGLPGALNLCTVDTAFCSMTEYDSAAFHNFCKYLSKQNVELKIPQKNGSYNLGNASFEFFGPVQKSDKLNDMSLVMKIQYGKTSFLIMADAEEDEERDILSGGKDLKCDVIKIGHHGSGSSSSKALIEAAAPQAAIISVGKDNEYGHPAASVLDLLDASNIAYYRTDICGDIVCHSDGNEIVITTEKQG